MLAVQNIQVPADFNCPMQGQAYVTKGGWATNDKNYAETTWFDVVPEEVILYRKLVSARLCRMLEVLSATTLAEEFGVDRKTVVKLARWSEGKHYRSAPWLLVRAVFEEIFETKIV